MSLDQELAAGYDEITVFLPPGLRLGELRADLFAAGYRAAPQRGAASGEASVPDLDPYAFQTRPTILRRLAAILAERLPDRLDRLVAASASAVPLTTAVALHTGLPFAVAGETTTSESPLLVTSTAENASPSSPL
ncbi:hypothetical protein KJK32_23745 [Streptomyces sp. JCM17656]|nr:hypothetical protein KJK32_23745 [Streptomyces sp. JCM17656]